MAVEVETALQPKWIEDIDRLLAIRPQFVLSGNIRDRFLTPVQGGLSLASVIPCLWALWSDKGFRFLLIHDRVDGIKVFPDTPENQNEASTRLSLKFSNGAMQANLATLLDKARLLVGSREMRAALIIDYASRLTAGPQSLSCDELAFFAGMEKLANSAMPVKPKDAKGDWLFNPLVWLTNRVQDLPSWYGLDSERIHAIEIARPAYAQRQATAKLLVQRIAGNASVSPEIEQAAVRVFAESTDDLTLQAMSDISQLAVHQAIPLNAIDDAIRAFKVGNVRSPWKAADMHQRIATAPQKLTDRVKGQQQSVVKTVDILTRSVMGLTGAQARSAGMRPRGVLFFAGPTGVGKTELAKALTALLFGDEDSYLRFDMSEFSAEHSEARLLGAPPGYVGYDAGGELTNRIRQKPFSVVLFDEIEKAHPRLLDKFLQILEDGRLTDGRGETVYFSESVIIFTSNLGIFVTDKSGERVQNVSPEDTYEVVETRVRGAILDYFKYQLSRPEILNRIGDNIVVFNFIRPDVAIQIFDGQLRNVLKRVKEEHGISLAVPDAVLTKLREWCCTDLSNGGRGIGNRIETTFINPLSRALFESRLEDGMQLTVADVILRDGLYTLLLD